MNLHLPSAYSVSSSFHLTPHLHLPCHLYLARHLHLSLYLTHLSFSPPYHDAQYSYRGSAPNDLVHVPYCKNLPIFGPVLSGNGNTFLRENGMLELFKQINLGRHSPNICLILEATWFSLFTTFKHLLCNTCKKGIFWATFRPYVFCAYSKLLILYLKLTKIFNKIKVVLDCFEYLELSPTAPTWYHYNANSFFDFVALYVNNLAGDFLLHQYLIFIYS
jgi:hypothetical protein